MSRDQSAAETLAEASRRSIRSGEYAPGQRLPSTRDLAQRFSASKATISQALDALRACKAAGLRAPEDVGLIGMTGLELSAFMQPSLSVVRQPMERVGREAARILLECVQHDRHRVMGVECGTEIVLRESLQADKSVIEQVNAMTGEAVIYQGNEKIPGRTTVNALFEAE